MHSTLRTALASAVLGAAALAALTPAPRINVDDSQLELGAFSVSLAVKDIAKSRAFYEVLGFRVAGGDQAQNWLVLRNGTTTIGLFQGMFEQNILTFNPGWGPRATPLEGSFTDVRELQQHLEAAGLELTTRAEEGDGPAHFALLDPDGNPVLVDQHVPKPK